MSPSETSRLDHALEMIGGFVVGWVLGMLLAGAVDTCAANAAALDLAGLVENQCGPPGYRPDGGCRVQLGRGSWTVQETRLGSCTSSTTRNSLTIEGVSAGMMTSGPVFSTAGTTLQYAGPAGGTMLELCGASHFSLRDLTLDARGAGTAIRLSADTTTSGITHWASLRDLFVYGSEIGVHVKGQGISDQVDFVSLERVSIRRVGTGYLQESQQAALNRLHHIEVVSDRRGVVVRQGQLVCDGCYVASLAPRTGDDPNDYIAFHLTDAGLEEAPWEAHQQVHIRDSHFELTRGAFVVEDAAAWFPLTLMGNSYSLQCTGQCGMDVLNSRSRGPVTLIGEVINTNNPNRPVARICQVGGDLHSVGVFGKRNVQLVWGGCGP